MAGVELSGVEKIYLNGFKAIHDVNVHINDGEFMVLVGPSGCGKSTLLRMIAGLETITEGTVKIGDRVVNKLEPAERDIAMVFQNYALYPHMSVYGNMAYGLKNRRIPKPEIQQRVNQAAEILEITEYLDRSPRQLSGGQRQRVAMGRAIVRKPSVFLFDEPLSNLDAKLRVVMRLEIKQLQERLGTTSVYVTHDQVEAMTLGHRLLVLNEGKVEQIGTPIELYERPETLFVAGFIGSPSMNFLHATLSADGSKAQFQNGIEIPLDKKFPAHANKAVVVGLRPEHLSVVDSGSGSGAKKGSGSDADFPAYTVHVVELLGADTLVHGNFGEGDTDLTVRLEGIKSPKKGDVLPLTIPSGKIHLFDPASEKRLT